MAVTRVTLNGEEATSQEMPSTKQYQTSDSYQGQGGYNVRSGPMGFSQEVSDVSQMSDDDLIRIGGSEMKVGMAKSLGLLTKTPEQLDPSVSVGNAAKAAEEAQSNPEGTDGETDGDDDEGTDNASYDDIIDGLNESLEAGSIDLEEAQAYETAFGQLALEGHDIQEAVNLFDAVMEGTEEVDGETKATLERTADAIRAASTKSAKAELGDEAFAYLENAATSIPGVSDTIEQFALHRATGQNEGITWGEFYEHVRTELENMHGTPE